MQSKYSTPYTSSRSIILKKVKATPGISQENQAIKKQKIDGGGIHPVSHINFYVLFSFFLEIVGYPFGYLCLFL